jgi:hypothetical protein
MWQWGDENVDWNGINNAAEYIGSFCKRWGRLGGQTKEKYGTVRFYAQFGAYSLFSITHPGYVSYWSTWPWYKWFDLRFGHKVMRYSGLQWLFNKWQPIVYSMAYHRALRKWPHLQAEILSDADYPELIKGLTRQEGNKLHVLDLNGKIVTTWTSGS